MKAEIETRTLEYYDGLITIREWIGFVAMALDKEWASIDVNSASHDAIWFADVVQRGMENDDD